MVAVGDDAVDHQPGEMARDLTPVAVLQPEDHPPGPTGEGDRAVHTVGTRPWPRAEQGESAGGAHGHTRGVTSGTTRLEDHGISLTKGCDRVPRTHGDEVVAPAPHGQLIAWIVSVPWVHRFWPADRPLERLTRCVSGLALFGVGIALLIDADLGAAPWDVFHTGVSEHTGIAVGTVIILTGVALLLLWIPLGETPGLGTVLNAVEIGLVVDLVLPLVPEPDHLAIRLAMMTAGVVVIAIGSGLYLGAGLGPGPRDGLMTGLARRGVSIQVARTAVEITVLVVGVLLGGAIGLGTAVFALGIGPLVQICLPRLTMRETPRTELSAAR